MGLSVGAKSPLHSKSPKKANEKRTLVLTLVAVEKLAFPQKRSKFWGYKAYNASLAQFHFREFSEKEFFNSHA